MDDAELLSTYICLRILDPKKQEIYKKQLPAKRNNWCRLWGWLKNYGEQTGGETQQILTWVIMGHQKARAVK